MKTSDRVCSRCKVLFLIPLTLQNVLGALFLVAPTLIRSPGRDSFTEWGKGSHTKGGGLVLGIDRNTETQEQILVVNEIRGYLNRKGKNHDIEKVSEHTLKVQEG